MIYEKIKSLITYICVIVTFGIAGSAEIGKLPFKRLPVYVITVCLVGYLTTIFIHTLQYKNKKRPQAGTCRRKQEKLVVYQK